MTAKNNTEEFHDQFYEHTGMTVRESRLRTYGRVCLGKTDPTVDDAVDWLALFGFDSTAGVHGDDDIMRAMHAVASHAAAGNDLDDPVFRIAIAMDIAGLPPNASRRAAMEAGIHGRAEAIGQAIRLRKAR